MSLNKENKPNILRIHLDTDKHTHNIYVFGISFFFPKRQYESKYG